MSDQLLSLLPCAQTILEYTMQFRALAASSGWNETALLSACRQGADPRIHTPMGSNDDSVGLESFMQKTNHIAQCLSACHIREAAHQSGTPAIIPPIPEPMQLDSTRLPPVERARRLAAGLCLYCASSEHFIGTCPVRPPRPAVSTVNLEPAITSLSLLTVQPFTPERSVSVSALVDSGSSGNFISQDLLSRLHLP